MPHEKLDRFRGQFLFLLLPFTSLLYCFCAGLLSSIRLGAKLPIDLQVAATLMVLMLFPYNIYLSIFLAKGELNNSKRLVLSVVLGVVVIATSMLIVL